MLRIIWITDHARNYFSPLNVFEKGLKWKDLEIIRTKHIMTDYAIFFSMDIKWKILGTFMIRNYRQADRQTHTRAYVYIYIVNGKYLLWANSILHILHILAVFGYQKIPTLTICKAEFHPCSIYHAQSV